MSGHRNLGGAGMTQNQGNVVGDRPCVRQSRLFRQHDSGNAMKDLMGTGVKWDVNQQQGAYQGKTVYDHNAPDNRAPVSNNQGPSKRDQYQSQQQAPPQQQQQQPQQYQQEQQQFQPQQQEQQQFQPQQQQQYQPQQQEQQQYQQQAPAQPMAPQPVNQQPQQQAPAKPRANFHNQNAGFNFFTGEAK